MGRGKRGNGGRGRRGSEILIYLFIDFDFFFFFFFWSNRKGGDAMDVDSGASYSHITPRHEFRFHEGLWGERREKCFFFQLIFSLVNTLTGAILDVDWKNNFQFASCGVGS